MYRYCLFDLDGTLTDPREGITRSVQHALRAFGIEEPDLTKLEPFIGPPLKDSFIKFYGFTEEEAGKAIEVYRERFAPIGVLENKIFPGVPEMLETLWRSGCKLAVASSKPTVFVRQILEYFGIEKYFQAVVGSELNGARTEKEEVVEEALRQLSILTLSDNERRRQCAMIGDRKFDIQGARRFGITAIGVSFGFAQPEELEEEGADIIVSSVEELSGRLQEGCL